MGITLELWRARIGCFVMPRKCRTHLETLKPVSVSLAIRLVLFYLLVAEGIESNPGPNSQTTDAGSDRGSPRGRAVEVEAGVVAAVVVVVDGTGEKRPTFLRMYLLGKCLARQHTLNLHTHYVGLGARFNRRSAIGWLHLSLSLSLNPSLCCILALHIETIMTHRAKFQNTHRNS